MSEKLSGQDSRQGSRGKPVLYILGTSITLMLAALIGLMIWQGGESPAGYADLSQAASRKQITGSEDGKWSAISSANSGGVPAGNPAYPQPSVRTPN